MNLLVLNVSHVHSGQAIQTEIMVTNQSNVLIGDAFAFSAKNLDHELQKINLIFELII